MFLILVLTAIAALTAAYLWFVGAYAGAVFCMGLALGFILIGAATKVIEK